MPAPNHIPHRCRDAAIHFLAVASLCLATALPTRADPSFTSTALPILDAHCIRCHGPENQKSGLRLDSPEALALGGDSGEPLVVPGDPDASYLLTRITHQDPNERMPPQGKADPLSNDQVETLRTWIKYDATLPDVAPPTSDHWSLQPVADVLPPDHGSSWPTSPIDAFVLANLIDRDLTPSPPADRRTLIRRLVLVAHGLPPTTAQVEAFLADTRPDAWPRLVDQVLASPRFGERWARHWLDVVRFAESNGFETNRERPNAYHYRDYVIDAFNSDKPYDQFVREQVAGDALGADVATGYLVAGPYDIVKSPDINLTLMQRQDELADMVNTTGTTFLGLTLGCARCHDHKFDPISQKDYYALQAVFAGVSYGDRPVKKQLGPSHRQVAAALRTEIASHQRQLDHLKKRAASNADTSSPDLRPPVTATLNTESFAPTTLRHLRFTIHSTNSSQPCLDELATFSPDGENLAPTATLTSSGDLEGYPIHKLEHLNDGKTGNDHSWISNEAGKGWVQLDFPRPVTISHIEWSRDRSGRFTDRVATSYTITASADDTPGSTIASSDDRTPYGGEQKPDAFVAHLAPADASRARELLDLVTSKQRRIQEIETGTTAWVANFSQPGPTHRLYRGDPMAKREVVAPDAPDVLATLGMESDAAEQQRRLKIADWLASPDNPLTARVMVNRLWQFTFGTGIVDTPSDFGANGTLPSHPELLDWLAADFVAHGWSMKHVLRNLFTSATFQQASTPRPDAAKVDASARHLWRFPPRRLEAEAIRDSILAAAGTLRLDPAGGPGFYLLHVDRENVVHYEPKEKTGPAEWRRMIYMFKIRQEQDAVFGKFDCPDGGQVIPVRSRSTTPLQALNLFNSQFVLDQARHFATRLADHDDPIAAAFEILYARPPQPAEHEDAHQFINAEGLDAFARAMLNTTESLFIF